jgi:hypothetical protein
MAARLTANQIADMVEELDDSFNDPDYEGEKTDSSSDSETNMSVGMGDRAEKEKEEPITMQDLRRRKEQPVDEIRVYMDPPIERADGDTDRDSGIVV